MQDEDVKTLEYALGEEMKASRIEANKPKTLEDRDQQLLLLELCKFEPI